MKKSFISGAVLLILFLIVVSFQISCSGPEPKKEMTKAEMIAHGKYLVNAAGCNDCHSPKIMTPQGPVPDTTRLLSGHPANEPMPEFDWKLINKKHLIIFAGDLTATAGPWGISYSANLTPDVETGSGGWQEQMFINIMRTGKHLGAGRPILPPMPWQNFGQLKDEDLKAIFAYLQSLPPIKNKVPDPTPPKM